MFHVDGAEFYSNNEFIVWSLSSVFAKSDAFWLGIGAQFANISLLYRFRI